jgi:hypothetical protein
VYLWYIKQQQTKNNTMKTQTKKAKKQVVKILGQEVTVGTKAHFLLVERKRLFDQNGNY